jgi:HemX protein
MVGGAYLITEIIAKSKHLGLFSLVPTGLGVLLAVIMLEPHSPLPDKYKGALFSFHIAVSLAAFACFAIAAIMAVMYAMLFKKLKKKQFDVFFRRLPPLEQLEQHTTVWVYFGILFIVVSPIIGRVWVSQYSPGEGMSPKEWGILLVAMTFLIAATARMFFKFRGFRFVASIIFSFLLLLLTQIFSIHGF